MPQVVAAAAAIGATQIAVLGGITVGTLAKGAFLVAGIASGIRAQRKARAAANASLQDRTTPVRASDMARSIVYGRTRVADVLAYHVTHGNRRDIVSQVVVLAGHEITAVDDIWFGDTSIGPLDAQGNVQTGSPYFVSDQQSVTADFVGGTAGSSFTLPVGAGSLVALDTLVYITRQVTSESYNETSVIQASETVTMVEGVDFTRSGSTITLTTDAALSLPILATYRIELGTAYARAYVFLGTEAGQRDLNLESWSGGEWPATALGRGVPRLHVLNFWNETVYATGFPAVTAIVRGKRVYDPRQDSTNGGTGPQRADTPSTWQHSANSALCAADYLRSDLGFGCTSTEIDWPSVIESANVCDESIPLVTGSQPRYTCNGVLQTDVDRQSNLEDILDSMLGTAFWSAGKWTIRAGAYRTPTLDLDQRDMVGALRWKARAPRRELFNAVRGRYREPAQLYAVTDYPPYVSPTYIAEDAGETLYREIDMPMVDDARRAQRIAKLALFRARQALTIEATFKLGAYAVQPGDTIRLSHDAYGWANKVFRVTRRRLIELSVVALELQEEAAAVYAWDFNEATNPDPAPNTNLPDPRFVQMPRDVSVTSNVDTYYVRQDGVVVPYVRVTWAQLEQDDAVVEVFWKRVQDAEYQRISTAVGATEARIEGVTRGETLNVYVWARNAIGAHSAIVWFPVHVVGDVLTGERSTSVNLVRNPGFEIGTAHWSPYDAGLFLVEGVSLRLADPGYIITGSPSSLLAHIVSGRTGISSVAAGAQAARVRVAGAGQHYIGVCGLIGWGVDARVRMEFRNAAGQLLTRHDGGIVPGVPVESALRRLDNPSHYELSVVRAAAPAGAAFVDLIAIGTGNWLAGPDKYVSIHRPMLAEEAAGSVGLPVWSPGPRGMVDTVDVRENALSITYSDRLTASRVVPGRPPADQAYIAQLPNVFMPPHDGSISAGARLQVSVGLNLQTTLATGGERSDITAVLGVSILEYNAAGTTLISGLTYPAGFLYQHVFPTAIAMSSLAGRTLYGSASLEIELAYRADRRYLIGLTLSDPVSGSPPDAWQQTALAGSHVTITVHKTSRAT
jgi:hypothetical protein